jgi:hypothetical protein
MKKICTTIAVWALLNSGCAQRTYNSGSNHAAQSSPVEKQTDFRAYCKGDPAFINGPTNGSGRLEISIGEEGAVVEFTDDPETSQEFGDRKVISYKAFINGLRLTSAVSSATRGVEFHADPQRQSCFDASGKQLVEQPGKENAPACQKIESIAVDPGLGKTIVVTFVRDAAGSQASSILSRCVIQLNGKPKICEFVRKKYGPQACK